MRALDASLRIPPSTLARKILCLAYLPSPFEAEGRFRAQAFHAIAVVRVIARHLKMGYRLSSIERGGSGYRIDLLFEAVSTGRTRIVEVKGSKQMREVHKIQAALYSHAESDEIVVSNREIDEVLVRDFIEQIRRRAEVTRQLLASDPARAATAYAPHDDVCYTCANLGCPYLSSTTQPPLSSN